MEIIYPKVFDKRIEKYIKEDRSTIREGYDRIFRENFDRIFRETTDNYKNDQFDQSEHNRLLSYAILPFLDDIIHKRFELLFIEPLKYKKNKKLIDHPIFDFVLAEFGKNNKISRLILGEVKGSKPENLQLSKMCKLYEGIRIKKLILDYINEDRLDEHIEIEFVLVINTYFISEYIDSLKSFSSKFNLWEIKERRNQYKIIVHEWFTILGLDNPYNDDEAIDYRGMLNNLQIKSFNSKHLIQFTYATQPNVYIETFYKYYISQYDFLLSNENIIKILDNICGGLIFYDDEKIADDWINKIKKEFNQIELLRLREKKEYLLQNVTDIEERIIRLILKNKFLSTLGQKFLKLAIKETIKNIDPSDIRRIDYYT